MADWFDALATVRLTRLTSGGASSDEIQLLQHPAAPVLVVRGPELLTVDVPSEVRIKLPLLPDFGPGTIAKGSVFRLASVTDPHTSHGQITITRCAPVGSDVDNVASFSTARALVLEVEQVDGTVVCPACGLRFSTADRWRWTGVRHRTCGQRIRLHGVIAQIAPVWCVVANIVGEHQFGPGGEETRRGTRLFRPNTKVHCFPRQYWAGPDFRLKVIGLHRGSRELISVIIRRDYLTNFRTKLVYQPGLVDRLSGFCDGTMDSKNAAESLRSSLEGTQ